MKFTFLDDDTLYEVSLQREPRLDMDISVAKDISLKGCILVLYRLLTK